MRGARLVCLLAAAAVLAAGIGMGIGFRGGRAPEPAPPKVTRAPGPKAELRAEDRPPVTRTGTVAGFVVSYADGAGVAAVPVTVARAGESRQAVTVAGGRFVVSPLEAGNGHVLTIAVDGCARIERPGIAVEAGREADLGTLLLSPPAALAVEVIDGGGRPLPGAFVRVCVPASGAPVREGTADAVGHASFRGLPAGSLAVIASAPGYATASVPCFAVPGPDALPVVVRLGVGFSLRGRVTAPDGKPASGRVVVPEYDEALTGHALRAEAPIDCAGSYRLEGLTAGSCGLRVEVPGRAPVKAGPVSVPEVEVYDISLPPAADLGGIVTDETGQPVGGAEVTESTCDAVVLTGADGRFRSAGLAAGLVSLGVRAEGYIRTGMYAIPIAPDLAADVYIVLARGVTLEGRVTAADTGEGLAAALVSAFDEYGVLATETRAGPDGTHRFAGLAPGRYGLRAAAGDYVQEGFPDVTPSHPLSIGELPARCAVLLPAEGVPAHQDLILTRAASIEGTVLDAAGRPLSGVLVSLPRELGDFDHARHRSSREQTAASGWRASPPGSGRWPRSPPAPAGAATR